METDMNQMIYDKISLEHDIKKSIEAYMNKYPILTEVEIDMEFIKISLGRSIKSINIKLII